jgi:hypothetical protein
LKLPERLMTPAEVITPLVGVKQVDLEKLLPGKNWRSFFVAIKR